MDEQKTLDIMEEELHRSMKELSIEHFEKPYFISYQLKNEEDFHIWGKNGAVYVEYSGNPYHTNNTVYAEVRVGDYQFDNTTHGGIKYDAKDVDSYSQIQAPTDLYPYPLQRQLWQLTDLKYKESLAELLSKKGRMLKEKLPSQEYGSFTVETPQIFYEKTPQLNLDPAYAEHIVRELSALFNKYPMILSSWIIFHAVRCRKFFVSSEGSRIITGRTNYNLTLYALTLAEDGMQLDLSRELYYKHLSDLPDTDTLKGYTESLIKELSDLRNAEVLEPYSGPALLKGEASAVFFHEAIGHRLEGERQISEDEGQTFSAKQGEAILPEFLSVKDDPTQEYYDGKYLMGSYTYDDQGVKARNVSLVENGILKNYLLSRTPVNASTLSNGHGRHKEHQFPTARMGNLMVTSEETYSEEELKEKLIVESKKRNKKFGIIILESDGGETNTSVSSFQAFSGAPKLVKKVDINTGREKPVRGVKFVGTPISAANKIIASGGVYEVFNGFCGAESGTIPVSCTAPSVLLEELELQRSQERKKNPPVIPPPPFK